MNTDPDRDHFDNAIRAMHEAYGHSYSNSNMYWSVLINMHRATFDLVMDRVLSEDAPDRMPSPIQLKKLGKHLRLASGVPQASDGFGPPNADEDLREPRVYYARTGNQLLLAYIRTVLARRMYRYGQATMTKGPRDHAWGVQASRRMQMLVPLLVQAKQTWVLEMVECPESRASSKALWDELMAAGEAQVDRLSSQPLPLGEEVTA